MINIKFNIFDLNFILCIVGFSFITSFLDFLPSVVYRAIALFVSIICLWKTGIKINNKGRIVKVFLFFIILFALKLTYELYLGEYEMNSFSSTKFNVMLFMYGITLIPLISFISGYEKINWLSTLIILEFLLLAVVGYGLFNLNPDLTNNIGRVGLNARQSTLAFGDKSAFLMILSISIILSVKNIINRDKYKKILYLLGGIGIVLSTMGVAKAASRGPFIGAILGALFLFSKLKNRYKGICVLLASIIIVSLGINLQSLSNFAPVLFNRMVGTIETGDSSGRDVIFVEAWNKMLDEPLFGGSSVILYYDSFSGYHNAFLNMGVSLGLFAFFAYIYFFYKICVLILTYKYSYNLDTYFTFGMIAFYIVRSITGIGLVGDIEYCVILSMACIKLSTINNKIYYD